MAKKVLREPTRSRKTTLRSTLSLPDMSITVYLPKFTGYEYYGVFTKVGETTVMILANKEAPETALYMTQIDEH